MAFPYDEINSFTLDNLRPNVWNNTFKGNRLFKRLLDRGQIQIDGGVQIRQPVEYAKAITQNTDGATEVVGTEYKKLVDYAVLDWKYKVAHTMITDKDEVQNSGDEKIIDFVTFKWRSMEKSLVDQLGTDAYANNSSADPEAIDGLALAVDTGNTYAGIAQGTYDWWQAAGEDSATTTISLGAMQTAFGSCYNNSDEEPTDIICPQLVFNDIWRLFQPQQRDPASGDAANIGWRSLLFNGAAVYADPKATASSLWFLNLNHIKLFVSDKMNFEFMPWKNPINQPHTRVAFLKVACNLFVNPMYHYKFTTLTSRVS